MNLQKLTFVIVTHVYATGPAFKLENYLNDKVGTLLFIGHPFSFKEDTRSFMRLYRKGKLVLEKRFLPWRGPEIFFYVKDIVLTLFWVLKYCKNVDYFVGTDNLNAFSGYLLKVLGKTKKYIFYTIDYVPNRFQNKLLNAAYHFSDRFAVKHSDAVWNLSSIMAEEREKRGVNPLYRKKQLVVPIGTDISQNTFPLHKVDRYKVVHLGHLVAKQGVEMLIGAMHDVLKKVPRAHLLVIGGGPLEEKLKRDVKHFRLEKYVVFTGFVEKFSDVQLFLEDAAIGVAPYVDDEMTFTRYTDPGKPKDYLAKGMPVIITKVPRVAYEIEKKECGLAIPYKKNKLVDAIVTLLTNDKLWIKYRNNAQKMAKQYTWDKIFQKALMESL